MENIAPIRFGILMCLISLSINLQARQTNRRYDHHNREYRQPRHYHHDPYTGERMAKGAFGGAATGALIGGLAGRGRGAGIGLGVGALTGLMAGAAASESHRYDDYYDDGDYDGDYYERRQEQRDEPESDLEEAESRESSESELSLNIKDCSTQTMQTAMDESPTEIHPFTPIDIVPRQEASEELDSKETGTSQHEVA